MSSSVATPVPRWFRNEDWLAVVVGGLILAALLAGWRPALPSFKWEDVASLAPLTKAANLSALAQVGGLLLVLSLPVALLLGARAKGYLGGYLVLFTLATLAQLIAGQTQVKAWGLEYVVFGLALGLLVNHTVGVPAAFREAVRTEFFIKTGLVIYGSAILFRELVAAGALGLGQSLLVVTVVWWIAYWLARRLRVDEEFSAMLSSAVAICGVSAAIAACGAIQGDRKKLSYVTSLVLIVAVPMMILMPWAVKLLGMPEVVAGAWLGGTLDTSGSVIAAGQLIGEQATKAGVIVKFSQNVLIGVAAFVLSVWWVMRSGKEGGEKVSVAVIWQRFPKFVLGFVAASLVFSFLVDPAVFKQVKPAVDGLRNFWFALAFVSIGLETNFGDLLRMEGGRPAIAFLVAQAFNVVWTLILAWLLFGGVFFAVPHLQ